MSLREPLQLRAGVGCLEVHGGMAWGEPPGGSAAVLAAEVGLSAAWLAALPTSQPPFATAVIMTLWLSLTWF